MLKRIIKIILVGLFSLLFIGLLYGLFAGKPEIIADESLRVGEAEIPVIDSQSEWAANDKGSFDVNDRRNGSLLQSNPLEQSAVGDQKSVISRVSNEKPLLQNAPHQVVGVAGETLAELIESTAEAQVVVIEEGSGGAEDDGFVVFEGGKSAMAEQLGALQAELQSDVVIISESSGFLDLNLGEDKPHEQTMVLVEGDQLVIDDLNQGIEKYKSSLSMAAGEEVGAISSESASNEIASGLDGVIVNSNASEILGDETQRSVVVSAKSSVFTMPKVDEALMQGDSEISRQYRQTMSRLMSAHDDLRSADKENAELQTRFDMTVNHNRKLAQIIRNIDIQIKSFTSTN